MSRVRHVLLVLPRGVDARPKLRAATLLLLLLCVPNHSSAFQGSFFSTSAPGARRASRTPPVAMDVAPPIAGGQSDVCLAGYWGIGMNRPGVPDKVLQAIREEPWRGLFEPCVDHALTEIEVEGIVPKDLQGTLFRNSG